MIFEVILIEIPFVLGFLATSTALTIAAVSSIVGAGVGAYGAVEQGRSARAAGKFNAKVLENEAMRTEMEGRESIRRRRKDNVRVMGRARARLGKAGVTEQGSPLEVMAETAGALELAALDERRAINAEASRLRSSAGMALWEGKQAGVAGAIQAGTTLFSGAASGLSYAGQAKAARKAEQGP